LPQRIAAAQPDQHVGGVVGTIERVAVAELGRDERNAKATPKRE